MDKIIVTIGGGEIKNNETEKIDRYIVNLSGKEQPRVLFIPTASRDSEGYIYIFKRAYSKINCMVDSLLLTKKQYSFKELEDKIYSSDIIYVGGGNTLFLYNYLIYFKIDKILKEAWENGIILSGLSAGCNIWHDRNLTDSIADEYNDIAGLGFLDNFVTPHYAREPERKNSFWNIIKEKKYQGIAIDDCCALVYENKEIKTAISTNESYKAYRVNYNGKEIEEKMIKYEILN
ncbi:MAG: type 1 glutamine amidotransferase-like domain-containing protein [archaeon]|nr:type 1 glutamine amidotransferase-like domain-containing protein [archaeon]